MSTEGDSMEDVGEQQLDEVDGTSAGSKDRESAAADDAKAADLKAAAEKKRLSGTMKDKSAREKEERAEKKDTMAEEFTLDEDALEEELTLDMKNVSPGGINANEGELKKQHDVKKALEAQDKLEEENAELSEALVEKANEAAELEEQLNAAIAKLQETKEKLKKSVQLNVELKEGVQMLTRKVGDVNLLNARLLYTNKTLGNSSLNERQKKQIAESVSRAKSVDEAKTIYETLQRSVSDVAEKRTAPQSLTEALSKSPGPFLPRKQPSVDPVAARWQLIAGIKK